MREVTSEPYIYYLKLTGNIDATDIKFLRDEILTLAFLDMSEATINGYSGTNGTRFGTWVVYEPNELPINAFFSNSYSLMGLSPLISVILPKNLTAINETAFRLCTNLTEIKIPNTVKTIGFRAFNGCKTLKKITIPSSVRLVGVEAFCNFGGSTDLTITELTIESSDTFFDKRAFTANKMLKTINCLSATPPPFGDSAFNELESLNAVYVPANAVAAYRATDWGTLFYFKILPSVTDAPSVTNNRLKIYSIQSEISIEGVTPGETVTLFSVSGKQLNKTISNGDRIKFRADKTEVYFIQIEGKIYKVISI
jgi:hypothetical protein